MCGLAMSGFNTIWGGFNGPVIQRGTSTKYNVGHKKKIHEETNAENTSGPHDESKHGGGRWRRPPPFGEGQPKAAPYHVAR